MYERRKICFDNKRNLKQYLVDNLAQKWLTLILDTLSENWRQQKEIDIFSIYLINNKVQRSSILDR